MLGLVFIYFIGKYFYQLAEKYNRSKWGFAIFGVASYYAGTFIAGAIAGILGYFFNWLWIDTMDERLLGVPFLPFGVASTYFLYQFLKKKWSQNQDPNQGFDDLLDSDL